MIRPVPCVHTWANDKTGHVHICMGLPSSHAAPCVCACGAEDWCTDHPTTLYWRHQPGRPVARQEA